MSVLSSSQLSLTNSTQLSSAQLASRPGFCSGLDSTSGVTDDRSGDTRRHLPEPNSFSLSLSPTVAGLGLLVGASMFKKFDEKENIGNSNIAKSSVQKGIRNQIQEQFQHIDDYLDQIMPKKEPLKLVKCHEHIELLCNQSGEILFFRQREGPLYPSLKLLHKYPFILPHMQVDKGAIRFVLSGANIMCPGLTSPGARMTKVDKEQVVAIMAEGKQHALAIGVTKMSSEEILSKNKGVGVDNIHFLNDGLWIIKAIK